MPAEQVWKLYCLSLPNEAACVYFIIPHPDSKTFSFAINSAAYSNAAWICCGERGDKFPNDEFSGDSGAFNGWLNIC